MVLLLKVLALGQPSTLSISSTLLSQPPYLAQLCNYYECGNRPQLSQSLLFAHNEISDGNYFRVGPDLSEHLLAVMSKPLAPRTTGRSHNYELFEFAKILSVQSEQEAPQAASLSARFISKPSPACIEKVEAVSAAEHSLIALYVSTGMSYPSLSSQTSLKASQAGRPSAQGCFEAIAGR